MSFWETGGLYVSWLFFCCILFRYLVFVRLIWLRGRVLVWGGLGGEFLLGGEGVGIFLYGWVDLPRWVVCLVLLGGVSFRVVALMCFGWGGVGGEMAMGPGGFVLPVISLLLYLTVTELLCISLSKGMSKVGLGGFTTSEGAIAGALCTGENAVCSTTNSTLTVDMGSCALVTCLSPSEAMSSGGPRRMISGSNATTTLTPVLSVSSTSVLGCLGGGTCRISFNGGKEGLASVIGRGVISLSLPKVSFVSDARECCGVNDFTSCLMNCTGARSSNSVRNSLNVSDCCGSLLDNGGNSVACRESTGNCVLPGGPCCSAGTRSNDSVCLAVSDGVSLVASGTVGSLGSGAGFSFTVFAVVSTRANTVITSDACPAFGPGSLGALAGCLGPLMSCACSPNSAVGVFS